MMMSIEPWIMSGGRYFGARSVRLRAAAARSFYIVARVFLRTDFLRMDYFLRKRSSRTTSAPSLGFAASS